jgi:hypothetical protein
MRRILAVTMAGAMVSPAAELNVRTVVLYKHGVGYFERTAELGPGESARLDFKASEMNDVLKSLTVSLRSGAGVAGLRYDSSEPLDRKLQQFPMRLAGQQPLSAVLDQLKGARLDIVGGSGTLSGAIVSARTTAASREQGEREQVTLLLDSGELRSVDLAAVSSIRFPDPKLHMQFKDYLATLVQARSSDKRSVYIDSTDAGRRQISATYMVPMPVWKSSYRLIFPAAGEPTLEGWAIVDNTTGEDWNGVNLSLVSGRPISFVSRLYEPKYVERPVVELAESTPVAPVVHQAAMAPPTPAAAAPAEMGRARRMLKAEALDLAAAEAAPSDIARTAVGRELGDLFEYRFGSAVTVRKNESAMLPFLQQKLGARKLLIYSNESSAHPMNAAEIMNSTGKTLDGGPITVYDSGAYAGEALVETVKHGDKRLISYGVDIGTRITTNHDSTQDVVSEIHVRRGVLETKAALKETKTYTIRNVDAKAKTLLIEHPIRHGYKLTGPVKPVETTANYYRFQIALAGGASEKFPVQEERVLEQTHAISSLNPEFLVSIVQNRALKAESRKQLESIVAKKREIAAVASEFARTEAERAELEKDQERVRQNLTSLNRVAGQQEQVNRYAKQLSESEGQLAALRDQASVLRKRRSALEAELNAMIEKMEF